MLIPYWSYSIEKNWNGKITKEIADTNIFCYGKKGTGKTERIGRMCLLRALDQRRSALVYASNNQEYMDLINTVGADQNIYIFNAGEETDEEDVRIIKQAVHTPTVIIVNNERFTDPHQITIVDQILNIWDEDTKKVKPEGLMHVILDDLCGNLYIRSRWLNNKHMKFCMIMGSEIASAYWRSNTCYDIVKYMHDHKIDLPAISSFAADADEKDEDYAMHRFSRPIETLLCTGVDGVRPQDHKEFIGRVFFSQRQMKLSGRFKVEEKTSRDRLELAQILQAEKRHTKQVEICDDIENSDYGDIAENFILPGRWIIELNGRIHCFHDGRAYVPVVLNDALYANLWIKTQIESKGIQDADMADSQEAIIYSFPRTDKAPLESNEQSYFNIAKFCAYRDGLLKNGANKNHEVSAIKISEKDVQNLRTNYLLTVLEYGELNANAQDLMKYLEGAVGEFWEDSICENEFFDRLINWIDEKSRPTDEVFECDTFEVPEEFRWKGYSASKSEDATADDKRHQNPVDILPQDNVLFLGGHQNMTKKLKQIFPNWEYISDDFFKRGDLGKIKTIFFWTNHSSHSMMEFVNSRKTDDAAYIYVTATNINRLLNEMADKYQEEVCA